MHALYTRALMAFQALPLLGSLLFVTDAPHGRFSPSNGSKSKVWLENLTVDGTIAWMVMELPSPITLVYTYIKAPLTVSHAPPPLVHPATPLVILYIIHYANRAVISPLRTPTRSRSHLIIPIASIIFNLLNAGLIGSWLSSGIIFEDGWGKASFWIGIVLFVAGFVGNVLHDEVLLNIRRDAKVSTEKDGKDTKPKYGIPHGYLYEFISYPNYLCEWFEWTGFALAASVASGWATPIYSSPPWLFVINEVALMLPRTLSGHRWYHSKFPSYPKNRRAVVPFLL